MPDLPITVLGQKTGYRVRLEVFEGPLDLLLHLIEGEELDITRVSLARVTDQYLEYLSALEKLQVDDLTDFVVVAARLLLIKSQALLPRPPQPPHPEDADAGDELIRQLLAYKRFKEAAKHLKERQTQGQRSYIRLVPQPQIKAGIEYLEPVSLEDLLTAAHRVMQMRPPTPPADGVVAPFTLSMNDQITLITQTLGRQSHVSFFNLLTSAYNRQEVAVTLLAVLELIKRQKVQARQTQMFGEIVISPIHHPTVPTTR
jgi:segregation and condensation protein A